MVTATIRIALEECIRTLVKCADGDGNLLFNVGPMPTGAIEPAHAARLREMGAWLKANGEAIYGTRGGSYMPDAEIAATCKGNTIYLHLLGVAVADLPPVPARVLNARVLGGGEAVFEQNAGALKVSIAPGDVRPVVTIVVMTLDQDASAIAPIPIPSGSLAAGKPATASNVYAGMLLYGADKAVDDNAKTRWAVDAGVKQATLEMDLGAPMVFAEIRIKEAIPRVNQFQIEARDTADAPWRVIHTGTTIGDHFAQSVDPVTARFVRLSILEASDGSTIYEIQVMPRRRSRMTAGR